MGRKRKKSLRALLGQVACTNEDILYTLWSWSPPRTRRRGKRNKKKPVILSPRRDDEPATFSDGGFEQDYLNWVDEGFCEMLTKISRDTE